MKIKSFFKDLMGAFDVKAKREETIAKAPDTLQTNDSISSLAKEIHPGRIEAELYEIKELTPDAKLFSFRPVNGHLPLFQAGQYVSLEFQIGKTITTRPYSICSAPYEAKGERPFFQIAVKRKREDGFVSSYLLDRAKEGEHFFANVGLGEFYYHPIFDSKNVVAIAGGSGITPFLSMAKEIKHGTLDISLTILYGSRKENDILLKEELEKCLCPSVKVVNILSDEPTYLGEKGFIKKDIIQKYSPKDCTYFVCGPENMYSFIKNELSELQVPEKRIHFEATPVSSFQKKDPKTYQLTVMRGIQKDVIPMLENESVAIALERNGIHIHTCCRSGVCGACRIKVLSGSYYVPKDHDQRRETDKEMNYVYACSTFPLSDMSIKINID